MDSKEAMVIRYPNRQKGLAILMVLIGVMLAAPASAAEDRNDVDSGWLGSIFGLPKSANITINSQELQSLGCLAGAGAIVAAVIVFSGAAIVVTGGPGAATTTTVAVPVLAAASMAGCLTGSSAMPGVAWLARNSEKLFGKIVDAIPTEPLTKILPTPGH
jgi:hypothetical protein